MKIIKENNIEKESNFYKKIRNLTLISMILTVLSSELLIIYFPEG